MSATPVANLELRISPRIFEKIRNGLNGLLWGWGETDAFLGDIQELTCVFSVLILGDLLKPISLYRRLTEHSLTHSQENEKREILGAAKYETEKLRKKHHSEKLWRNYIGGRKQYIIYQCILLFSIVFKYLRQ